MPHSPNLLFTNAGMNQFVPISSASRSAPTPRGARPTPRSASAPAASTTTSRMSGSTPTTTPSSRCWATGRFGDYFKKEAIEWAWELVTEVWGFPTERLYATVYEPAKAIPAQFDQEAYDLWARLFSAAGLDPAVHIVNGNKKDNFWMMGETGPCGPCSELHVDLTPDGDTEGSLVNAGDPRCIEIWNLVFIQFNAKPDGTLPRRCRPSTSTPAWASSASAASSSARRASPTSPASSPTTRPTSSGRSSTSWKAERPKYASTLPAPGASWGGHSGHGTGEGGHRLPRHRRSHPHPGLRHRRRHPARQQRPQLRAAPHPAPGRPLRSDTRIPPAVSASARGGAGRNNGGRVPGDSQPSGNRCRTPSAPRRSPSMRRWMAGCASLRTCCGFVRVRPRFLRCCSPAWSWSPRWSSTRTWARITRRWRLSMTPRRWLGILSAPSTGSCGRRCWRCARRIAPWFATVPPSSGPWTSCVPRGSANPSSRTCSPSCTRSGPPCSSF